MLMIHTNLIRKYKNNPDSTECADQATKMNMCLFYNKRKQSMYGSKKIQYVHGVVYTVLQNWLYTEFKNRKQNALV